jgi:hypothetical protein
MAVRWRTPPTEMAALVTESSTTRFAAELFHFGEQPRPLTAELRLLKPGKYRVQLDGHTQTLEVKERGFASVGITLPPQKLSVLTVEAAPR